MAARENVQCISAVFAVRPVMLNTTISANVVVMNKIGIPATSLDSKSSNKVNKSIQWNLSPLILSPFAKC